MMEFQGTRIEIQDMFAAVGVLRRQARLSHRELLDKCDGDPLTNMRIIRTRQFDDPGCLWLICDLFELLGVKCGDIPRRVAELMGLLRGPEHDRVDFLVHRYRFVDEGLRQEEFEALRSECLSRVTKKASTSVSKAAYRSPPRNLGQVALVLQELRQN